MNGNNVLLDTNIVLYLLNGEETLIPLLDRRTFFCLSLPNWNFWEIGLFLQTTF